MKSFAIILAFILVVYQVDASEEEEGGDINIVIEQHVELPGPPDVDECFEDIDTCADNELCVNNPGSYTCICADGYEKVKGTCEDVDECSKDVAVCGDFSECINIVGSFSCKCTEGFEDVEGFCEDIDECSANENLCDYDNRECVNILGNFTCNCKEGFEEVDDICKDVDECSKDVAVCGDFSECINIVGSFSCKCTKGFEDVEGFCEDIDECSANENLCDYDNRECVNILGNFTCNCKEGFEEVDDICKDIDECNADNICGDNADCTNFIGSYTCPCNLGYADIGSGCEYCFIRHDASGDETFEWTTPRYPDNYPENTVCMLAIAIFSGGTGTTVTVTVKEPGKIHDSSNNNDCMTSSDYLSVSTGVSQDSYCGDLQTGLSWTIYGNISQGAAIILTFQSNSVDEASAKGIKFEIEIINTAPN